MMNIAMTVTSDATVPFDAPSQATAPPPDDADRRLTLAHLFGVLIGRSESVLAAARDRSTLLVGLLFVLTAGLAREYDGEDLRREPWHLLIPLGASLVLSFVLFLVTRRWSRPVRRPFWSEYLSFLGLFWLTAPMAMLYGIPWERMLSPVGAVYANLMTLALVATWRVLPMARIVQVFTNRALWRSLVLVMIVADALAFAALLVVPLPVIQFMGGIRLMESDIVVANIAFLASTLSVLTLPIWLVAAIVVWQSEPNENQPAIAPAPRRLARLSIFLALACLIAWCVAVPGPQREQRLRGDAERLLRSGQIREALAEMSRHDRSDYPPAWDPPPRLGWPEEERPAVIEVVKVLDEQPIAPWVREAYIDKFERRWFAAPRYWQVHEAVVILDLLDRLPEGPALRAKYAEDLKYAVHTPDGHRTMAEQATTRPTTERNSTGGLP